jgi:FixJ family two-component response regulator
LGRKLQHSKDPLISVVDDDLSLVEAVVTLLQSAGYKAKGFHAADDFLKSRQLRSTACLILDVRMPGMGGLELRRRLAAENLQIPIIFITSYESEDVRTEAPAVAFLSKPFSQESLFEAVRSALADQERVS